MRLPKQCVPVKRPHFVQPASCVDVVNYSLPNRQDRGLILQDLLFGANYNDPAAFAYRNYNQVMHSSRRGFANISRFF